MAFLNGTFENFNFDIKFVPKILNCACLRCKQHNLYLIVVQAF